MMSIPPRSLSSSLASTTSSTLCTPSVRLCTGTSVRVWRRVSSPRLERTSPRSRKTTRRSAPSRLRVRVRRRARSIRHLSILATTLNRGMIADSLLQLSHAYGQMTLLLSRNEVVLIKHQHSPACHNFTVLVMLGNLLNDLDKFALTTVYLSLHRRNTIKLIFLVKVIF